MPRLVAKHSLPTRVLHWLNVPVLGTLIWSGIAISGAKKPYTISIGGRTLLTFFPEGFFRSTDLPQFKLPDPARAIGWHFTFIWLFFAIGGLYLCWTIGSGTWREIVPKRRGLRDAWFVFVNDLKSSKPYHASGEKYNAAQRLAYTLAIVMMVGLFLSGLAIFRPTQLSFLVWMLGGYLTARAIHFWLTIATCGFIAIHVLQVIRAGWNTFRAMVIGVEVVDESEAVHVEV